MDKTKLKRGVKEILSYDYLRGRLDCEAMLEDLGIDIAFRRGNQIMCHCPNLTGNHKNNDANPSFGFNEDKLAFNCFVCNGGNVVELVQMMKPDVSDVLRYLEGFSDFSDAANTIVDKLNSILYPREDKATPLPDYPLDNLFQYRKIHPYLYRRGLTKEVIMEMQVGYDDEHLGIVIPHLFMGKLVGIQRRHIAQDAFGNYVCPQCGDRAPKYKNTPNFPKVNTLYGYDRMRQKLQEENGRSAIIVESPMTALKLISMGLNRIVATFGQFSKEQAMLLIAIPVIYYWPDNDDAGYNNTIKAIEALGRFVDLKIVPAVPGNKSDAANLDTASEVVDYLKNSYPASLFPTLSKEKLATLSTLTNTNIQE